MNLRSIMKIICQNKKYLLVILPCLILTFHAFVMLFIVTKIPYSALSCFPRTGSAGQYVYFVHGYNGQDSEFRDMINYLNHTGFFGLSVNQSVIPLYFNYYDKYYDLGMAKDEIHNIEGGISSYAQDFYEHLYRYHGSNACIDIVAHSLGGLITREMLRCYREALENLSIKVSRVITLGTPHFGTELPNHPITESIMNLLGWKDSQIDHHVTPGSKFLTQLNRNPNCYMEDIDWYFVAGVTTHPFAILAQELIFGGVPCDGLVACKSALATDLAYEPISRVILQKNHVQLVKDQNHESYEYINKWLSGVQ